MNKVILIGRVTADPTVRYSDGETPCAVARYSIAVNRRTKKDEADFIRCVALGKQGEFAEKYLRKGMKIAVTGRIQTGSYSRGDERVYTTEVVIEEHEFCESKNSGQTAGQDREEPTPASCGDGFMNIPDGIDEELPFT